jgi:hypothetical protein
MSLSTTQQPTKEMMPADVARQRLTRLFEKGDESVGVAPMPNPQRVTAAVLMTLLCDGVEFTWGFMERVKLEVQLRPSITAKMEFSGPPSKADIERLKRHLDLMAETLPDIPVSTGGT